VRRRSDAGDVEKLLSVINISETFLGNAYKGAFFQNGIYRDFNERERMKGKGSFSKLSRKV
jgi:hypothetical protein